MKGSLSSHMKVGVVHFMAYPETGKGEGPILETVRRIARDEFFGAIEITHIKDAAVRSEVRKVLDTSGLVVGYGAHPIILSNKLDLNHEHDDVRGSAVDLLKACVDEAYEVGARSIVLLSGRHPGSLGKKDAAIARLVRSMKEICAHAETKGDMRVVLETFDYDIEKCALIGLASDAARVAEEVRKEFPRFGLLVDLGHLPLIRETSRQTLEVLREYVVHVHIGNCVMKDRSHPAYGDQHPRFGTEGGEIGVVELADFLRVLFDVGYLGGASGDLPVVAYEVKPLPGEDPEIVLANSKRTLLEAWARLSA